MKARNIVELMCKEVVELVTDYLSHAMAPEDRVCLEQHLLVCPPCTAYLQQVRTTMALAHGLRDDEPPADIEADLLSLFRRRNRN